MDLTQITELVLHGEVSDPHVDFFVDFIVL